MERIGLEAVFLHSDFQRGVSLYLRGIANAERETQKVSRSGVGGFDLWTGAIIGASSAITDRLIDALVELGAKTAQALTHGVQEAGDLEYAIDGIRSVIQVTDAQADQLTDTMFDIALDPTLQADIFDVAEAMDVAARAGARFEALTGDLTRQIIVLANATGGELVRAADILTSAQIVFADSTEDTAAAVNSITAAINSSKLSLDDYRFSLANAGGAAEIAGTNFRDFNFLLAAAVPAFSGGRRAGQGFASMLSSLVPISKRQIQAFEQLGLITFDLEKAFQVLAQNGVAPAGNTIDAVIPQLLTLARDMGFVTKEGAAGEKQFQQWAKSLGIFDNQLFDTNGNLREANDLIAIAREALSGLTSEQQIELATSAFGREGMDFFIALANVDPTRLAELNAEFERTNAADVAAMRIDNFAGAMEQLKDTSHALSTQIGLELLPALTSLVRLLTAQIAANAPQILAFFEQVGVALHTFSQSLSGGASAFDAFNAALGDMLKNLGYGRESVETLQAVLTRFNEILSGAVTSAMQFASENAVALSGALQGVMVALAVTTAVLGLAGALAILTNPIAQLIAVSAALGAAWATDFMGMRTAVLWFWEAIQPALQSAIALGGLLAQSIGQLANDFAAGWNAIQGDTNTAVTGIGQAMFELGRLARDWGVGLVNALSEGILAAVGAVVEAINVLGSIIAYWMQPGSPPRFLPDLDKWGTGAAEAYLEGWSLADFNSLDQFGDAIRQVLQSLVSSGGLDEEDANPILLNVREQMAAALDELNRLGSVSEATFASIRAAGGEAGEEIEAFARQYISLNAAMEAVEQTSERLKNATEAQTAAQDELDDILSRIQSGDSSVTMDDYRAAQARLRTAKQEVRLAETANKDAKERQTDAQKEFDLFKARMGIQTDTLSIIGQQKAIMERLASLASEQAAKIKEGLTDLEKQIKAQQLITAQYNDRIRLAELDAILADEKATAQEKELARQEKNLILLEMQQRALEAAELGIDLSVVDNLPIVLESAAEKAGKLAGTGGLGSVPGLAQDIQDMFGGINEKTSEWKTKTDEVLAGVNKIKDGFGGLFTESQTFEFPFLEDLKELQLFLSTPISFPPINFPVLEPPEWLGAIQGIFNVEEIRKNLSALEPFFIMGEVIAEHLNKVGQALGESLKKGAEAFAPIGEQLSMLFEAWRPLLEVISTIVGGILLIAFESFAAILNGVFIGALNAVATAFGVFLQGLAYVTSFLITIATGIGNILSSIVVLLSAQSVGDIQAGFQRLWDGVIQIVVGVVAGIITTFVYLVGTVATLVWAFVQSIISFFQDLYTELVGASIIPDMVTEIIEWFTTLDDEVWRIVDQMWTDVMTAFDTAIADLLTNVTNLVNEIVRIFTETDWGKLGKDLVINIANGIVNNLGRIGKAARDLVQNLITSALNAIAGYLGGATQTPANDPNTNSGGGFPGNAQGTNYWRGGMTWVGEQGAELVSMANRAFLASRPMLIDAPRGTQILDATATRNFLNRGSVFGRSIPASNVTNTNTVINNNEYHIATNSAPVPIMQALAVKQLLDP